LEFDFQVIFVGGNLTENTEYDFKSYRTCYQSKNYENLQQLRRKPQFDSLESLAKAKFTFGSSDSEGCQQLRLMLEERGLPM
jgi:hypothetical protein